MQHAHAAVVPAALAAVCGGHLSWLLFAAVAAVAAGATMTALHWLEPGMCSTGGCKAVHYKHHCGDTHHSSSATAAALVCCALPAAAAESLMSNYVNKPCVCRESPFCSDLLRFHSSVQHRQALLDTART